VKGRQLGLFQAAEPVESPVLTKLRALDVDHLTPIQALTMLADLKREAADS
jgi:hypothetical protein